MAGRELTVWVLGAGFSRPLGGPLLTDLFSEGLESQIEVSFGDKLFTTNDTRDPCRQAIFLYRYGTGREHSFFPGGKSVRPIYMWPDAEAFLVQLETASRQGKTSSRYQSLVAATRKALGEPTIDIDISHMLATAKRWTAAECSLFLQNVDIDDENWGPFRRWARHLSRDTSRIHTIITFNYDRVLEMLASDGGFEVLLPTDFHGRDCGETIVLKLHGSVDWKRSDGKYHRDQNEFFAIESPLDQLAIATPGRAKSELSQELGPLWSMAERALSKANRIVFVGYRFPESDAEARGRFLRAINENHDARSLEIVLGPDVHSPQVERMKALLGRVAGGLQKVVAHPLFAEDLLDSESITK